MDDGAVRAETADVGRMTLLQVSGMTCGNCARQVTTALQGVPGVMEVAVRPEEGTARVRWHAAVAVDEQALGQAVRKAGFQAEVIKPAAAEQGRMEFTVEGMTCQNCARHVSEAARGVSGVRSAKVHLDEGRLNVEWEMGVTAEAASVEQAVKAAGYTARVRETESTTARPPRSLFDGWGLSVVLGLIGTAPLLAGEWLLGWGETGWFGKLSFWLALPVQVLGGARFYRGAWSQLKAGRSNMDTLVALGSTTAFAYSLWGLATGKAGHLYFVEAAAIITLISVGHWIEAKVGERAAGALRALMRLAPPTARRIDARGQETEVPLAQLRVGDRVAIKPGDRVPTDGEVTEGSSSVTEAMLTGEAMPVEKALGARLYAGTENVNGRLVMRVTATGAKTALAQIIAVVERAQNSRANIQRLADRISNVFVPVVVLIALGTALAWGLGFAGMSAWHHRLAEWLWPMHLPPDALAAAVVYAAAVLIVACPCAMGLATPAAIMAAANAAARRGILIRDGLALEKSGRITTVLFDKTGTLTQGRPEVAAFLDLRPEAARKRPLWDLAGELAKPSQHPLSQSIARAAKQQDGAAPAGAGPDLRVPAAGWPPFPTAIKPAGGLFRVAPLVTPPAAAGASAPGWQGWEEVRGQGVRARWQDEDCRLGSLEWLRASGVDTAASAGFEAEWAGKGATVVGLAQGAVLAGVFALRDPVKPHAASVVRRLRERGLQVGLVTGDSQATALAVALEVGIARLAVFSRVAPEAKAGVVAELRQKGDRVAFVGDGINDAPALTQADLGIAVSRASDVAREAADLVLLRSDIEAIPEALGLAQAALRTIRQNLFWAFFYNTAAIPLAAMGFLSPVLCAAAMGLSDVMVIGNALRLYRRKG